MLRHGSVPWVSASVNRIAEPAGALDHLGLGVRGQEDHRDRRRARPGVLAQRRDEAEAVDRLHGDVADDRVRGGVGQRRQRLGAVARLDHLRHAERAQHGGYHLAQEVVVVDQQDARGR